MAIPLTTRLPGQGDMHTESMPVLELTYEERQRSRLAAMLPNGRAVAIVLARGESMQHGDVLCAEGGERVQVQAAAEAQKHVQAKAQTKERAQEQHRWTCRSKDRHRGRHKSRL